MFVKSAGTRLFALALLLACFGIFGSVSYAQRSGDGSEIKIRMISPRAGETLRAGQRIRIVWEAELPADLDLIWCEQEVYLSLDGGKTISQRITPRLGPGIRFYDWTVPNTPTNSGVINIHFGSESSDATFERAHPQLQSVFKIVSSGRGRTSVNIHPIENNEVTPDSDVQISWDSGLKDVNYFEVLVSFDRGAHFHPVGKTQDKNFAWHVPADFSGLVTFQVVAHRQNGRQVRSIVPAEPMMIVRGE
ncbi:MAG: hypothetical protein AB1489_17185 [Acidobacteriota bacterium]